MVSILIQNKWFSRAWVDLLFDGKVHCNIGKSGASLIGLVTAFKIRGDLGCYQTTFLSSLRRRSALGLLAYSHSCIL